ncbi:hypothetical protein [Nannocystis punicea]|uniref:Uncharacterized protein n=1 Tax=Nannocystis punicea TaxID=2995304 RepID=A0ABY7HCJ0_9BACT|nr:hypothetical protein [Nannocystis poenicansa]WAS96815.1 hypothetical protein O0S08_11765 [Nannocystis poenicansa]
MRHVLFNLSFSALIACGGGDRPGDGGTTTATEPATGEPEATATTTGDATATTTGSTAEGAPTTGLPGPETTATSGTDGPVDGGPCANYALVLDRPGPVLWATTDGSVYEAAFLQPGQGFNCVRVEFDLQTLDNLDDIVALDPEGCPEFFGIASVFGTQPAGKVLATVFYHPMDRVRGACTPGDSRLEVGNHLAYTADTPGPWSPGQVWHVILEAKPWLTRVTVFSGGQQVGPTIAAALDPLDVAVTRDPLVRLGLPGPVEDRFYPWYGATWANLQVWADVAP